MRWLIIGGVLALVVTVYALVDLTVTDDRRIRRLNRVLWVVLIVTIPVFGAIGWLAWGKGPVSSGRPMAPDDDPSFSRSPDVTDDEADRRIAEIEAQLAALDAEVEIVRPTKPEPDAEPKPDREPDPEPPADDTDGQGHRAPDDGDAARA